MLDYFLPSRNASNGAASPGPLSDFWYSPVGRTTTSHVHVNDQTALTYSAVWAATRLLAGTSAWLPLNLHRRNGARREIAYDDPRQRMVHDRPNSMLSSMMFRVSGFSQQINGGNFYAEIVRDVRTKKPVSLWPIAPRRVRVVVEDGTDNLWYMVKTNSGKEVPIPAVDIFHVPSTMSDDGIRGKGVIDFARETIGTGIAAERRTAADFGSGRLPKIVIESPGTMTQDHRDSFRREWNAIHSGENGHQVAQLGGGATAKVLSTNAAESQFNELRQFTVEEIARWYGVPPHMLQHLLRSTFNNVEQLGIDFVTYSLMPWLKLWEQELWFKLLTPEEKETHDFRFNVNGLLRGDSAARREWYRTMVTLGVFSRNEVRELEEMNPVEGGDVCLIQGAMVAIGDDGIPMLPAASANGDVTLEDDEEPEDGDTEDAGDGVASPNEAAMAVARAVLQESLSRMAFKELQAATRAANDPSKFSAWLTEFYESHTKKMQEAIRVAAFSLKCAGVNVTEESIVSKWCNESRTTLDACLDTPQATFATVVKNRVADWSSVRVGKFVDEISTPATSAA